MKYSTTDLAIIIPTRNRPFQVKLHLQSLVEQDCEIGKVIVVASGKDIKDIITQFENKLPIEYYRSKSGQVIQRNLGISNLNKSTKLVASMDDDIIYSNKNSITEMINFWNSVEPQTAGVGFNIVNLPSNRHNWFRGFLGFSASKPGRTLKSGFNTAISNVKKNIKVEWLNGGSSVWRQDVLLKYSMEEFNIPWAVCEDLIYSYPLGKQFALYVCADAKIKVEENKIDNLPRKFHVYRGRAMYLMGLFFVLKNQDLSIISFIINKLLFCFSQIAKGIIFLNINNLCIAIGIIKALIESRRFLLRLGSEHEYKVEFLSK